MNNSKLFSLTKNLFKPFPV